LQTFIDARYERSYGGRPLTESEITGLLIAALFAGMHTSTITSSWTGLFLASHKEAWDACVEEQRRIVAEDGTELSVDVLGKMNVLHACITEALRMYPPLIMMLRYARQPFTVTGSLYMTLYGNVCRTVSVHVYLRFSVQVRLSF
jgi:sterol 14alpha-demethylase